MNEWMTLDELRHWSHLLETERDYMMNCAPGSFKTPRELVVALVGTEDDDYENYQLTKNASGVEQVKDLLNNNSAWGEMVGAVVGSFHLWAKKDQQIIRASLTKALSDAATYGIDH